MTITQALSLCLALAAFGQAFADDITVDPTPFVSTLSHAQVQDELRQHRQAGIDPWADDFNPLAQFQGGMTRAEVTAEFMDSRSTVAAFSGEDSGSTYLARAHAPDRGTVLARTE